MEYSTDGSTLVLSGALDLRCSAELRHLLYTMLAETTGDLHVDIDGVESVDLTTLKLLAVANRVALRDRRRVILRGGTPGVRRLLHLSHLRQMLSVEPGGSTHPTAV